jgi:hypothetical protein
MVFYPNNDKIALDHSQNLLSRVEIDQNNLLILGQEDDIKDNPKGVSL